jgi:hypothetical protein
MMLTITEDQMILHADSVTVTDAVRHPDGRREGEYLAGAAGP